MTTKSTQTIDDYVDKIAKHLLKRFPDLKIEIVRKSSTEVAFYFSGESEDETFDVIKRAGSIATDALVSKGFRLRVLPGPATVTSAG